MAPVRLRRPSPAPGPTGRAGGAAQSADKSPKPSFGRGSGQDRQHLPRYPPGAASAPGGRRRALRGLAADRFGHRVRPVRMPLRGHLLPHRRCPGRGHPAGAALARAEPRSDPRSTPCTAAEPDRRAADGAWLAGPHGGVVQSLRRAGIGRHSWLAARLTVTPDRRDQVRDHEPRGNASCARHEAAGRSCRDAKGPELGGATRCRRPRSARRHDSPESDQTARGARLGFAPEARMGRPPLAGRPRRTPSRPHLPAEYGWRRCYAKGAVIEACKTDGQGWFRGRDAPFSRSICRS